MCRYNNTIRLSDGLLLGYAEFGAPRGKPLVFLHGFPGSRFDAFPLHNIALKLNIRLIAFDRPGFGLSTVRKNRTILDLVENVTELAGHLSIDKFAMLGFCGGGPYAAACALKIPLRLTSAALVSSLSPVSEPEVLKGMTITNRAVLWLASRFPVLLRLPFELRARMSDRQLTAGLLKQLPEVDRELLKKNKEFSEIMVHYAKEAFHSGAEGSIHEAELFARPWGFNLEDIPIKVFLWQGERDTIVPPAMGSYLAKAIPDCTLQVWPEGHFSLLYGHMEEILRTVVYS